MFIDTPDRARRTNRNLIVLSAILALGLARSAPLPAQTTPQALAARVAERFAIGDSSSFEAIFPFAGGRELVADAVRRNAMRHAGLATVLTHRGDEAILLLSGYAARGHSGTETLLSRAYSDFYRAERRGSSWALVQRLPLDAESRIISHRLNVTVMPGEGLRVLDTMVVSVAGTRGFAARLDHAAKLLRVTLDRRPVDARFGAGLLWLPVAAKPNTTVVLEYHIEIPHDPDSFLSYFLPTSGFVRDQALWHPVLNYASAADRATFDVTARIPTGFHLSTSIAQQVRTEETSQVVRARTDGPVAGITLAYDANWVPYVVEGPAVRIEAFVNPEFQPSRAALDSAVRRTFTVLHALYGAPSSDGYLAIIQRREAQSSGWHMLSNSAMIAGRNGRAPTIAAPTPRAFVGHELAHRWTRPTGPGAFFLMEGWATFAESFILADEYGPDVVQKFWESQRQAYERGDFDGVTGILADDTNNGVSYSKGAWILRMLRDDLGSEAFDRGMRAYMAIRSGEDASLTEFARALSAASGRDVAALLRPWIAERTIPVVTAEITAGEIVLRQSLPLFDLPLDIELVDGATRSRRTVRLSGAELRIPIQSGERVSEVVVDPDRKLLVKRPIR